MEWLFYRHMDVREFESEAGTVVIRNAELGDIPRMIDLYGRSFPVLVENDSAWREDQLQSHIRLFAEGQVVAELNGKLVGVASSLIVSLGVDPLRAHTYYGITDDGYFYNHDVNGDTLYGADVYVDPTLQRSGIGRALYEVRRDICRRFNLKRILSGGRIRGYNEYADQFSADEYVSRVQEGELNDPVLSFQISEGFVVRAVMPNYIRDEMSRNNASLIEWLNPDYQPSDDGDENANLKTNTKVRVS
jgi:GNAT superfamily N-acetyltransferase